MKNWKLTRNLFFISAIFFLSTCSGGDDEIKICSQRCSSSQPWRVESLDLNLPCFATKEACVQWAASHGYSDKPCILCN